MLSGFVVFPLTGMDRVLRRPGERFLGGLRTYPLAILGLVVLLPPAEAAAAWAVLAYGDAAAAVVGTRVRAPAVLGHPKVTWSGLTAGVVVGAAAAWAFSDAVAALAAGPGGIDAGAPPGVVACVLASAAGAFADLALRLSDDTLPIAAGAGVVLVAVRGGP